MSPSAQRSKSLPSINPTAAQDWALGWRYESVRTPDGRATQVRVPLTVEEARHPQEKDVMPERTEHDRLSDVRIGLDGGRVWLEATTTGNDLLTNLQVRQALRAAEVRIADLEAQLQTLRERSATTDQS